MVSMEVKCAIFVLYSEIVWIVVLFLVWKGVLKAPWDACNLYLIKKGKLTYECPKAMALEIS
jgi:hypothetical protein